MQVWNASLASYNADLRLAALERISAILDNVNLETCRPMNKSDISRNCSI